MSTATGILTTMSARPSFVSGRLSSAIFAQSNDDVISDDDAVMTTAVKHTASIVARCRRPMPPTLLLPPEVADVATP